MTLEPITDSQSLMTLGDIKKDLQVESKSHITDKRDLSQTVINNSKRDSVKESSSFDSSGSSESSEEKKNEVKPAV